MGASGNNSSPWPKPKDTYSSTSKIMRNKTVLSPSLFSKMSSEMLVQSVAERSVTEVITTSSKSHFSVEELDPNSVYDPDLHFTLKAMSLYGVLSQRRTVQYCFVNDFQML